MKKIVKFLVLFLAVLMLSACGSSQEIEQLNNQLTSAIANNADLSNQLVDLQAENERLSQELRDAKAELQSYNNSILISEKKQELIDRSNSLSNVLQNLKSASSSSADYEELAPYAKFLSFVDELNASSHPLTSAQSSMINKFISSPYYNASLEITKFDFTRMKETLDYLSKEVDSIHQQLLDSINLPELYMIEDTVLVLEEKATDLANQHPNPNSLTAEELKTGLNKLIDDIDLKDIEAILLLQFNAEPSSFSLIPTVRYSEDFLVILANGLSIHPTQEYIHELEDQYRHCGESYAFRNASQWIVPIVSEILSQPNCTDEVRIALLTSNISTVLEVMATDENASHDILMKIVEKTKSLDTESAYICSWCIMSSGESYYNEQMNIYNDTITRIRHHILTNPKCTAVIREAIVSLEYKQ